MKTKMQIIPAKEFSKKRDAFVIRYSCKKTRYGMTLVGSIDGYICAVIFCDTQKDCIAELKSMWEGVKVKKQELPLHIKVFRCVETGSDSSQIPVFMTGTDFQVDVWKALLTIPENELRNYADIATLIKKPKAVRAAATAVKNNNNAFIVPCHRVIRSDGSLGKYRWGLERKKKMLGLL